MITSAFHRFGQFMIALTVVGAFIVGNVHAQDKPLPRDKGGPGQSSKGRATIPLVRIRGRSAMGELPGFAGRSGRRILSRPTSPPTTLPPDVRMRMLRESGIDVRPVSAPSEFRLSPRQPYVSGSAYLFFVGEAEFDASGDSLTLRIEPVLRIPNPRVFPGGEVNWTSGGPQPDPPAIVSVLIRMDPRSGYLADFSVSAEAPTNYHLTVSGAEGLGDFSRDAGGQHVAVVLESTEGSADQIHLWCSRSFTFHNVVVTKLD